MDLADPPATWVNKRAASCTKLIFFCSPGFWRTVPVDTALQPSEISKIKKYPSLWIALIPPGTRVKQPISQMSV